MARSSWRNATISSAIESMRWSTACSEPCTPAQFTGFWQGMALPHLIDEAFPGAAFFIAQGNYQVLGNAREGSSFGVAEAIDHGVVGVANGRAAPDVAVLVQ